MPALEEEGHDGRHSSHEESIDTTKSDGRMKFTFRTMGPWQMTTRRMLATMSSGSANLASVSPSAGRNCPESASISTKLAVILPRKYSDLASPSLGEQIKNWCHSCVLRNLSLCGYRVIVYAAMPMGAVWDNERVLRMSIETNLEPVAADLLGNPGPLAGRWHEWISTQNRLLREQDVTVQYGSMPMQRGLVGWGAGVEERKFRSRASFPARL